jgi:CHAT domain-containing protein
MSNFTFFLACSLIIGFLSSSNGCYSQCYPSSELWMEKIEIIEGSSDTRVQKIKLLNDLKKSFAKCVVRKDSIYARIMHRLGELIRLEGDFETGIKYARESVEINKMNPFGSRSYLAHTYYNLGQYYALLDLLDNAYKYYDSCIRIGLEYKQKSFLALKAFEKKAYYYFRSGDYQKSIDTAEEGLFLAVKSQDVSAEALLLLQKAQAQIQLSQLIEAEKNIKHAIQNLMVLGKINMLANAYSVYGKLLSQKRDFKGSVHFYRKAFQANSQIQDYGQCIRDLNELGYTYDSELLDSANAIACYKQALGMIEFQDDVSSLAVLYNNLGQVYWRNKDFLRALKYYQQGLLALPIHFNDTSLHSNPTSSMLKFVVNDYFVCTLLANKGESLLAYYKQQNKKEILINALNSFKVAMKVVDQMRWKQQGEQSKLYWREKTRKWYAYAIEICYLLKDTESAFYFFEKSRAVLLNDKLAEIGAKKYLNVADVQQEQALRIKVVSAQSQLSALPQGDPRYAKEQQNLFSRQEEFEKFIRNLEKKYPAYYHYKYDTTVHSIDHVRENVLAKNQSLVEYFTTSEYAYALVIAPGETTLHKLDAGNNHPSLKQLSRLSSDQVAMNLNYKAFQRAAYDVYVKLFAPLAITTPRVIVSQDDQLIPFETLLKDSIANNSFLLNDYAFSYTYSVAYLLKAGKADSAGKNLLGIAPVEYKSYLHQASLIGADKSLLNIEPYFSSASLFTHTKATKRKFLENLSRFDVVHLYSHAQADSTTLQPIMYLNDSILDVSELQTLGQLQTKLIILLACNTGIGKNVRGEGVLSLARGFAAAGIPATITTLWQIDNQSTYTLSELFFKHLQKGLATDEALQQAKLEFLRTQDVQYTLPYYWGGSVLVGKSHVLRDESFNARIWFSLLAGLVTLSVLIVLLKKKKFRSTYQRKVEV